MYRYRMMLGVVLLGLFLLAGCAQSLKKIHASEPRRIETFQVQYHAMTACAKEGFQTEEWVFDLPPIVQSIERANPHHMRIYVIGGKWVFFETTFHLTASGGTLVEYRDPWTTDNSAFKQAWTVIERCAETIAAKGS
jgi:hypothetical protein